MRRLFSALILLAFFFSLHSCYYDNVEELYPQAPACDTTNVTYSVTVWPIIESKCFGCHSGNNPGGNIFLRNYTDVVVVADDERLWGSINHETGFTAMPKNLPKLSECELAAIRIWIEEGAQDN